MRIFKATEEFESSTGIKIGKFSAEKAEPDHMHEFLEFVYIYSGEGIHSIDGIEYNVMKGDMLFVNINQVHSFYTDTNMYYVNICVKPDFLIDNVSDEDNIYEIFSLPLFKEFSNSSTQTSAIVRFPENEIMMIDRIMEQLISELKVQKIGYKSIVKGYMRVVLSMYLRECSNKNNVDDTYCMRTIAPEIIEYIDAHSFEKITLNELAEKCFYNPSYFCRTFKKCYGESLKSYIQRKRISCAVDLLSKREMSISEIGEYVGYFDKAQFYKVFKKHMGVSPNEYRKNMQK